MEPVKVKPGYVKYILENPSLIISFVENKAQVRPGFGHLGFQVETIEELNLKMESVRAKNLILREETGTNCCYAIQDKFWVKDPDNYQWEVYYFHADAEFDDPHFADGKASCCTPTEKVAVWQSENSSCC